MIRHRRIIRLLYEYLRGELDATEERLVSHHLASCATCSRELEELRSAIDTLDVQRVRPSEERSAEFWKAFVNQVEDRAQRAGDRRHNVALDLGVIEKLLVLNRRLLLLSGSGVAIVLLLAAGVLFLSRPIGKPSVGTSIQPDIQQAASVDDAANRLHQYFRKSKVLLIGVANMDMDSQEPLDLSSERRVSRDLVEEARYLQSQPLDRRSEKLIADLEKILIELANLKEQDEMPNVEIIRGGIHKENMLFKIRTAESMYDTARFLQAMNKQ